MSQITLEDFRKIELKVGQVVQAEEIPGSEKLIRLEVDLGEEKSRQILTGMKTWYQPNDFLGKQVIIISNLEPKQMMGLSSQGMILAVDGLDNQPVLLRPEKEVTPGAQVR